MGPRGILSTIPAVGRRCSHHHLRWISPRCRSRRICPAVRRRGAGASSPGRCGTGRSRSTRHLDELVLIFTAGVACVTRRRSCGPSTTSASGAARISSRVRSNALVAFVGSGLMARMIYSSSRLTFAGKEVSLQNAIYQARMPRGSRLAMHPAVRRELRDGVVRHPVAALEARIFVKL